MAGAVSAGRPWVRCTLSAGPAVVMRPTSGAGSTIHTGHLISRSQGRKQDQVFLAGSRSGPPSWRSSTRAARVSGWVEAHVKSGGAWPRSRGLARQQVSTTSITTRCKADYGPYRHPASTPQVFPGAWPSGTPSPRLEPVAPPGQLASKPSSPELVRASSLGARRPRSTPSSSTQLATA